MLVLREFRNAMAKQWVMDKPTTIEKKKSKKNPRKA